MNKHDDSYIRLGDHMLYVQKDKIVIKHYQDIINLDKHIFECRMDQRIITISGKDIVIHYYGPDEIVLHGQFQMIKLT